MATARRDEVRQVLRLGGGFRADLVSGCEVLHIHRDHDDQTLAVAKRAHAAGIGVIWDNDDDFEAVPRGNVAYRRYGGMSGERAQRGVRRMLGLADVVTTTSPRLADRYRELGAGEVRVIENHVRDETVRVAAPPRRDGVTVGWVAGKEHHLDAEQLPIRSTLERLLAAHPDLRVTTIGVGLGIADARYEHIREVRFEELPERTALFDVGIAPIADLRLNLARSNVKLKEYAAVGVPWLASARGPYLGLGERQGGRLVDDDGWHDAIARLVDKQRERRRLAKRALKWGRTQTISQNTAPWADALAVAVERARGRHVALGGLA